jgi:hypothetical protein
VGDITSSEKKELKKNQICIKDGNKAKGYQVRQVKEIIIKYQLGE